MKKKCSNKNPSKPTKPVLEELEPRLLFSADIEGILINQDELDENSIDFAIFESDIESDGHQISDANADQPLRNEIVFIDPNTPDYQQLVDDLLSNDDDSRNVQVFLLNVQQDGISQIGEILSQHQFNNIDAIHVISHASDGAMQLGTTWLSNDNLNQYADTIAEWQGALSADADLLIYGCDFAAGSDGQALIENLGMLTGADVAASDDLTGSAELGGDWELEHQVGVIETRLAFSLDVQANWSAVLATETVRDEFSAVSFTGNNGTQNWGNNWQEVGDPTPGAVDGDIRVRTEVGFASNVIRFDADNAASLTRDVDLSSATSATLTFDYKLEVGGGSMDVEVFDGTTWQLVTTYNLNTNTGITSESLDISAHTDVGSKIRFQSNTGGGRFWVDNIQVEYTTSSTTTIGDGTLPADRNGWAGGKHFGVSSFTLATDSGTDTLTGTTVTFSGTDVNDVDASGVKIWRDDGAVANQWDSSDTLIDTGSFSGSTATFTGMSESINTTATQYLITYDLASGATAGNTLQASVTAATVTNTLVNNDNTDATLTVDAPLTFENDVYKIVYSPGSVDELYLKETSSAGTDILQGMSLGTLYSTTPGSILMAWDPDATVTTSIDNDVVTQVQMSGALVDSTGTSYGTITTNLSFYEDRVAMDISMTMTTNPGGTDYMFMTYGQWDDACLDETFRWSNNDSGSYNTVDPAPNFNSGDVTTPITLQSLFEMGATDGLVSTTLQNVSNYDPAQFKYNDPDSGAVDVAFQKVNPGLGIFQSTVIYSFDTTTTGFDTSIAESRQDDSINPAALNFGVPGGDGAVVGDGFNEQRGVYTLDDNDADDHVQFEFQTTGTHIKPVFEITNWNTAAPTTIIVDGVTKAVGTDFDVAVEGTTLYVQYLGDISSNATFEIGSDTISGTVYSDEGVTNIGAGKTVRLLVNGVDAGATTTDGSGAYSFQATLSANDKVLVYIDGDNGATDDGTTVTVVDGNSLANFNIYTDHFITRHDNGGALTNADITAAKGVYADTEILYSVSGSDLTVSGSNTELYVLAGHSYAPGGNVTTPNMESVGTFNGGAGTIDINGDLIISGGSYTATSGDIYLNGDFTVSAGSFVHNSGALILDNNSAGGQTVNIGSETLNDVAVSLGASRDLTVTGTMDVDGDLTINSVRNIDTGTIAVSGNVTTTDVSVDGSATILFDGAAAQILQVDGIGGTGAISGVDVNKSGGTLTIKDTIRIDGANNGWTYTAGTVDAGTSTIVFSATTLDQYVNSGAMIFNNVMLATGTKDLNVTGTMDVNGDLTITSNRYIDGGTIAVSGNVLTTDSNVTGSGTVLLDGAGAQLLSASGGTGSIGNVNINKSAGTLTIQDTISARGNWTYTSGAVDAGTSTIVFNGASGDQVVNSGAMTFNNVTLTKSSWDINVTGTMDVDGDLSITSLRYIDGGTIAVSGDVISTDTNVAGSGSVLFDGAGAQSLNASGGTGALGSVGVNKSGGTLTLEDTINVGRDWTYTGGTVDAGTSVIVFNAGSYDQAVNSGAMAFNDVIINKAADKDVTITGTMDINGDLTITSVKIIGGGNIAVAGNLTSTDSVVDGIATITLDGSGAQTIDTNGGDLSDGIFTINKASGTAQLISNMTSALDGAGQDFAITQGTLDLNGFDLTVPDVLTVGANSTLQLEGDEIISATTTTLSPGSTVLYDGAGSYTGLLLGNAYTNLTFNGTGTWTLDNALDVDGNLTIASGTLDVDVANDYQINIAGDWSNSDTFNAHGGTVTFDGGDQAINGSTTFNNFTKADGADDATDLTLTFDNTATQAINGTLTLDGLDADDRVVLVSDSVGNQWSITLTASATKGTLDFLDITDSDASGSDATHTVINPTNSIDGGNNTDWFNNTPTDISISVSTINENTDTSSSVSIGTLSTSDPDVGDTFTYSIVGGADQSKFSIGGGASDELVLTDGVLDRETKGSYQVTVRTTDSGGLTFDKTLTISVNDLDEFDVGAVSDSNGSGNTVAEDAIVGTTVGVTASASDADATNNTITYTLDDDAGGLFTIDANSGVVTVATASLDAETAASHNITVRATSSDTSFSTQVFTVNVSDVDEFDVGAVSDANGAANTVAEDAIVGTAVGVTASAADGDATNNTITYSLDDDASGLFSIDANSGVVSVATASLDAETAASHNITVRATSSDTSFSTQVFTINVSDVDEFDVGAVSDSNGSGNTVAEDAIVGTTVSVTASASDADATNNTITYSLDDDASGLFTIDANSGVVTVATASLDAETATSHNITVRATSSDTSFSTQVFTINVSDVDEFDVGAVSDSNGVANTVAEDAIVGTAVGVTASASDADATNNTITYSLDDDAGGLFTIDVNSGVVTVATASLDAETATSHNITVRATSSDTSFSTQVFTINVSDADEFDVGAVSDSNGAANTVAEDAIVGTTVGVTASASDADATNNTITYSLDDDAGGLFTIDVNSGVVTVATASLDAETATNHNITVRSTSSDTSFSTQVFTINVSDVDEFDVGAVSDSNGSGNTVAEDAIVGTTVGVTASASDADATNNTITYSLDDDAGGLFTIDANSGVVTVATASLDAETATNHNITVRATSSDTSFSTQAFTINVSDVDEFDVGAVSDSNGLGNTVAEDAIVGTAVGVTASASDADATNNTITYTLDDDAGGLFTIDVNSGVVTVATASLDAETATSHNITVRATSSDTSFSTQAFTISVTDINENPDDIAMTGSTINENIDTTGGFSIGTLNTSDVDTGDTFTYSIVGGADQTKFSIGGVGSDELLLNDGVLDFDTQSSYQVIVRTTDSGGLTFDKTFTITVNDLNDAPTANDNTVTTNEDAAYTFSAADFNFVDLDGGSFTQIQITSLESVGSLQLNGVDVTLNQVISIADINAGSLTFTPVAGASGDGYDSFGFSVHDGTSYSVSSYTQTINVTPAVVTEDEADPTDDIDANTSPVELPQENEPVEVVVELEPETTPVEAPDSEVLGTGGRVSQNTDNSQSGNTAEQSPTDATQQTSAESDQAASSTNTEAESSGQVEQASSGEIEQGQANQGNAGSALKTEVGQVGPTVKHQTPVIAANGVSVIPFELGDNSFNIDPAVFAQNSNLRQLPDGGIYIEINDVSSFSLDEPLGRSLAALGDQLSEVEESLTQHEKIALGVTTGVSVSFTTGFVAWALRGGALASSFLANVPLWHGFDPLPILSVAGKKHLSSMKQNGANNTGEAEADLEGLF